MRDYGQVSPSFWIGETGKQLRGDANAQLLALYLQTGPHSTMTGVFHCPILYMAHETGIGMEGATKALARLCEVGFCEYDEASECVFVVRMAAYQIAESLKPGDNRITGLKKEVSKMTPPSLRARFLAAYSVAFCLGENTEINKPNQTPSEAPSKPGTGTGTGTGTREKTTRAARTPAIEKPDGVDEQVWQDWQQLRKAKKAAITKTVIESVLSETAKAGITVETALRTCCEAGWAAFRADWYAKRVAPPSVSPMRVPVRVTEPEWRTQQRERMRVAAPGVLEKQAADIFDVEARHVTALAVG